MSVQNKESMKMAPLRPLGDFILDTRRYQAPAFSDLKRFNNRVTSNLLYYQTNYFGVSGIIFLLFLMFGLNRMLIGGFGIVTSLATLLFQFDKIPQAIALKSQYPIAPIVLSVSNLIVLYMAFKPVLYFVLAILLPIAFWIIHASMRCRGLKNKINNKMEQIGASVYANSPMGSLLSALGLDTKEFEE